MTHYISDAQRHFVMIEFGEIAESVIDENSIDWRAVNERIKTAMWSAGINTEDVCELFGLDISADNYAEQRQRLPKIKTAVTVAAYIGAPASWILTGKGKAPFTDSKKSEFLTAQKVSKTAESTVIQGTTAGTIIVNGNQPPMSEQKRELNRIFDYLSIRAQTKLLYLAYQLEDEERHKQ